MRRSVPLIGATASDPTKKCPDCAETVRAEAHVCKHCGYRFDPAADSSPVEPARQTVADFPPTTAAAIGGLVLLAIGSIGPWATILGVSVAGTRGDGKLTLGLAIFAALMLAAQRRLPAAQHRLPVALAFLATLVAAIVAGYDLADIERTVNWVTIFGVQAASAGWGLYVAVLGAVIALLALIAEHSRFFMRAR
jgi:hypothetical protein